MIKNMLTGRKESDIYLATVSRHRWSRQTTMKIDFKNCSFQPALWLSSAEEEEIRTDIKNKFSSFILLKKKVHRYALNSHRI